MCIEVLGANYTRVKNNSANHLVVRGAFSNFATWERNENHWKQGIPCRTWSHSTTYYGFLYILSSPLITQYIVVKILWTIPYSICSIFNLVFCYSSSVFKAIVGNTYSRTWLSPPCDIAGSIYPNPFRIVSTWQPSSCQSAYSPLLKGYEANTSTVWSWWRPIPFIIMKDSSRTLMYIVFWGK